MQFDDILMWSAKTQTQSDYSHFLNAHEPSMTTGLGVGLSSQQALFVVMWLSLNKIFTSMSLQMIKIKWIIVPYDIIKV